MKITKRQLRRIIREEYSRLKSRGLIKEQSLNENWHVMSRSGQQIAQVAKRRFRKLHPEIPVGILAKQGWITIGRERIKAVNMSQAASKPVAPQDVDPIDHIVNQMIEKAQKHGLI
jgi:hypothetical protein